MSQIEEVYAVLELHPDGSEHLVCAYGPGGQVLMLVGPDLEGLRLLHRELVPGNVPVKIVRFSNRSEVEQLRKGAS